MPDIEHVLSELNEKHIIVEGKKDVQALNGLGLLGAAALNGKPLGKFAEGVLTGKEVVILTDFDRQGKRLNARLCTLLQRRGIHPNARLRHMVRALGKTKIEDFNGFDPDGGNKNKRSDNHGKIGTNVNKVHNQGKDFGKRSYRETGCDRGSIWTD